MATKTPETGAGIDISALKEQLKAEILADMANSKKQDGVKKSESDIATEKYLNEYVDVQLFRDGKDYKDDVFVAVNGENCHIKRGVPVKIKRKFALVLEEQERQDIYAAEYSDRKANEFSSQARVFNI